MPIHSLARCVLPTLGVALTTMATAGPPQDEEERAFAVMQAEEPAIEARQHLIEAELAERAKNPPAPGTDDWAAEWAGQYYSGDGLGMNARIMIAPKSGVTYTWHGCMGLYDANHGDIAEVLPDGLRLKLVLEERQTSYQYMSSRLYFVRSRGERFIVPAVLMINYVNRRNGVTDLIMSDPPCRYEGRRVNRDAEVGDDFPLPAEFEAFIIRRPITLTVVDTADIETGISPIDDLVVHGRVNLKSDPPVYPGLEFPARCGMERGWITIDRVDGESCSGTLLAWGPANAKPALPQPGETFRIKGADPAPAIAPAPTFPTAPASSPTPR